MQLVPQIPKCKSFYKHGSVLKLSIETRSCHTHGLGAALVSCCITFKTLLLTVKCVHGLAPPYLSALLSPFCPTRSLRSSDQLLLKQPTSQTKISKCSFFCAVPRAWNQLPLTVRQCMSLDQFMVALKTRHFTDYFNI